MENIKIDNQKLVDGAVSCPFRSAVHGSLQSAEAKSDALRYIFRQGMSFSRFTISGSSSEQFGFKDSFCQLCYLSKGELTLLIPELGRRKIEAGNWFIISVGDLPVDFSAQAESEIVLIGCGKNVFEEFGFAKAGNGSSRLECLLCEMRMEPFFLQAQSLGRLKIVSEQISLLNTERLADRLMLESRALEWLAVLLDEPDLNGKPDCASVCSKLDESALLAAADYLEDNLGEDHSIAALSREVHLNEFKLKQGFKKMYDKTIFTYLREKRMDSAESYLRQTEKPVIEVCNIVGYANPSHFSRAFKERFGMLPKAYQKKYS